MLETDRFVEAKRRTNQMKLKQMTHNRFLDPESGWQFEYDVKPEYPGKRILRCYSSEDVRSMICSGVFEDTWISLTEAERQAVDRSVRMLSCPKVELEAAYKKHLEHHIDYERFRPARPTWLDASAFDKALPLMLAGWRELILVACTAPVFLSGLKDIKVVAT